ncbi:hypothetical protein [Microvirga roseola]|uniref:hypothetical protein n=1 Tax=Microvirga roseola TaxID=2883126 RepID=UPI001E2C29D5|nr:hypothetical protein [Microvirga roseola]
MSQSRARPGHAVSRTVLCRDWIEGQIIRAYVRLVFAPDQDCGSRTITIMRSGNLEVRLTELPQDFDLPTFPPFWVEIHSHATGEVLNFCGCYEFDEDELGAAVELVLTALMRQPRLH